MLLGLVESCYQPSYLVPWACCSPVVRITAQHAQSEGQTESSHRVAGNAEQDARAEANFCQERKERKWVTVMGIPGQINHFGCCGWEQVGFGKDVPLFAQSLPTVLAWRRSGPRSNTSCYISRLLQNKCKYWNYSRSVTTSSIVGRADGSDDQHRVRRYQRESSRPLSTISSSIGRLGSLPSEAAIMTPVVRRISRNGGLCVMSLERIISETE